MSIFKETFPKFVKDQLLERETIISSGIDSKTGKHDGSRSNDFFTYTSNKQCVLRLSSGVDIEDLSILEGDETSFINQNDLPGSVVAENWVLEGGVKDQAAWEEDISNSTRGGIGSRGAYGDTSIRSDAQQGYGIVPMPGIIDAQIRTKSAYGSLREGKVKFVCHNKRQLEILETLYMRPGYTLLLEWQNTPYFKDGKITHDDHFLENFFTDELTHAEMNNDVLAEKQNSQGNYDALIGYCRNFSYTLRPDGGFNCETEIIAKGEIIESLKTQKTTKAYTHFDSPIEQFLTDLNEVHVEDDKEEFAESPLTPSLEKILGVDNLWEAILPKGGKTSADQPFYPQSYIRWDALANALEAHIPTDDNDEPLFYLQSYQILDEDTDNPSIEPLKYVTAKPLNTKPYSIRRIENLFTKTKRAINWEAIDVSSNPNICLLPHMNVGFKAIPSAETDINDTHNKVMMEKLKKLSHHDPSNIEFIGAGSFDLDNYKTWMPDTANERYNIGGILFGTSYLKSKFREMYYNEGGGTNKDYSLFKFIEGIWNDVNSVTYGHNFTMNTDNRPIGKIVRIIDKNATTAELDLTKVFELKIQSPDSTVRDVNYSTTIPSALSSTIAIAAQAPDSIDDLDKVSFAAMNKGVRDRFAVKSVKDNKGRILKFQKRFESALQLLEESLGVIHYKDDDFKEESIGYKDYNWNTMDSYEAINSALQMVAMFSFNLSTYKKTRFSKQYNSGGYGEDANESDTSGENLTRINEAIANAHKAINILSRSYASTDEKRGHYRGQLYSGFSPNISSIIPLKFNCKMDGISGIRIGNVFKLPADKLPKGYGGEDIHFIVMGEEQSITSGQDWTTSLSGHLILLGGEDNFSTGFKFSWLSRDLSFTPNNHPDDNAGIISLKEAQRKAREYAKEQNFDYEEEDDEAYLFDNTYRGDNTFLNPLTDQLTTTSNFGMRYKNDVDAHAAKYALGSDRKEMEKRKVMHPAIDLRARMDVTGIGKDIIAVADGVIDEAKDLTPNSCGGFVSLIIEKGKYTEGAYKLVKRVTYCHLSNWNIVTKGQKVKRGDIIGTTGGDEGEPGAGSSIHGHLHFTVFNHAGEKINPTLILNLRANWREKLL